MINLVYSIIQNIFISKLIGSGHLKKYTANINNITYDVYDHYYDSGYIATRCYYFNNQLHNTSGPAVIYYYDNSNNDIELEKFYLNDVFQYEIIK